MQVRISFSLFEYRISGLFEYHFILRVNIYVTAYRLKRIPRCPHIAVLEYHFI